MLVEDALLDDVDALREIVAQKDATCRELEAKVAILGARSDAEITRLTIIGEQSAAEIIRLNSIIAAFQRHRFGARSEQLSDDQFDLVFEELATALSKVQAGLDAASPRKATAQKRKINRGSLPAHLERIEQIVDVEDKACRCCGGDLHVIGEDMAERLDVVPATFRVLVTRRPRYGCRTCEGAIVQAPAPSRIVEGGIPTEALIAHVVVSKYADHLPLYRQAQIYARQGVNLDRSTLADWVGRTAWWLAPLRDHALAEIKRSTKIFADETTAPVLDPGRGRTKTGQLWAYVRDDRPWAGVDPPVVAYVYAPDRTAARPIAHLAGFSGILQVDGYQAYEALAKRGDVTLAFCWAHVRRKFFELAKDRTSPVATEALTRIAQIYAVEADIRAGSPPPSLRQSLQQAAQTCYRPTDPDWQISPAHRQAVRQEHSAPMVKDLRQFLDAKLGQLSRKSKLAEAIRYALTRWDGLTRFLEDGRIELDNNSVERSIRPLAMNRKNALFAGSDDGGEHWAIVATMIENCKLSGVNPQAWLTQTLTKLANGHKQTQLDQLMPWNFNAPVNVG